MRRYIAGLDINRHELVDFEFESDHKAGSKANKEDCLREYRKRHGRNAFNSLVEVKSVYLVKEV